MAVFCPQFAEDALLVSLLVRSSDASTAIGPIRVSMFPEPPIDPRDHSRYVRLSFFFPFNVVR